MPLGFGLGISYSPLLYRSRSEWHALYEAAVADMPQPKSATEETDQTLDESESLIQAGLRIVEERLRGFDPETLIVLVADRDQYFEESNRPQIHIFSGDSIWGRTSEPNRAGVAPILCDPETADLLIEELVARRFDIAESRGEFRPLGTPDRGTVASLHEFVARFANTKPIVPIHINCHYEPRISGKRLFELGRAISESLELTDRRVAIVASGGLSGNPGGYMAGWLDPTFDQWALKRLVQGRTCELAPAFQVESNSLLGSTAEYRLWTVAGAAMESRRGRADLIGYIPLHHAASAIGMITWRVS